MPTYEYACTACGHRFEVVQSMRDEALSECPECGGVLRKVFAPPAIAFKGSGFYATDHGKRSPTSSEDQGDGKSGDAKGEGREGKGEKPAASKGGGDTKESSTSGASGSAETGSSGTAGKRTTETTPS